MTPGDRLPTKARPVGALRDLVQDTPPARLPSELRAQVARVVDDCPNWDGVITIAGAGVHHWLHVSAGEVISMMGFLTPQLIVDLGGADHPDQTALSDTMTRPERLAAHLRSAQLSGDGAAITGHLIGAELAAAKVYWLGQEVRLIGQGPYLEPLQAQGVSATCL